MSCKVIVGQGRGNFRFAKRFLIYLFDKQAEVLFRLMLVNNLKNHHEKNIAIHLNLL